jgi:hypothetical protein
VSEFWLSSHQPTQKKKALNKQNRLKLVPFGTGLEFPFSGNSYPVSRISAGETIIPMLQEPPMDADERR